MCTLFTHYPWVVWQYLPMVLGTVIRSHVHFVHSKPVGSLVVFAVVFSKQFSGACPMVRTEYRNILQYWGGLKVPI